MPKEGKKRVRFDEADATKPSKKPREGQAWLTRFQPGDDDDTDLGDQMLGAPSTGRATELGEEGETFALPDEAAARRFLKRGELEPTGGSLLDDVHDAEAAYDEPEELFTYDGIPLEPFSLARERETGYFDAEGNYLEFANNEDTDAWLEQFADEVVTFVKAREAAQQAQQAHQDEEQQPQLSREAVQECKRKLIGLLQPGENVLAALRRLGQTGRQRRPPQQAAAKQGSRQEAAPASSERSPGSAPPRRRLPPENRAAFDTLTDASSMLLASGEFSAHSNSREDFEREVAASDALDSVDIFADAAEPEDAAGLVSTPASSAQAAAAEQPTAGPATDAPAPQQAQAAEGPPAAASAPPEAAQQPDAASSDKTQAQPASSAEPQPSTDPEGSERSSQEQAPVQPPASSAEHSSSLGEGVFDESTRLWYYSASGCFWDGGQLWGDAATGEWWKLQDGQYIPVSA